MTYHRTPYYHPASRPYYCEMRLTDRTLRPNYSCDVLHRLYVRVSSFNAISFFVYSPGFKVGSIVATDARWLCRGRCDCCFCMKSCWEELIASSVTYEQCQQSRYWKRHTRWNCGVRKIDKKHDEMNEESSWQIRRGRNSIAAAKTRVKYRKVTEVHTPTRCVRDFSATASVTTASVKASPEAQPAVPPWRIVVDKRWTARDGGGRTGKEYIITPSRKTILARVALLLNTNSGMVWLQLRQWSYEALP